jgi:hypothetical protein
MIKEISEAFQQKDYQKAELLLNEFKEKESENPWFEYYQARLEESKNNLDQAEESYLKILKNTINLNPQLFSKIRNGIERIKKIKATQKQEEIKEFKEIPNSEEFAVLILEPIPAEEKKIAAQKMAEIMEIDLYSARLQIPSRGLKFYRSGNLGELKYYESRLNEASIPCFCLSLKDLDKISVYQVKYIESIVPELIFVCENNLENEEPITIKWSDINNLIKAALPLFESSVHVGRQGKLERKTTTLDYAQFYDLHLNDKNMILRFNDQNYQFDKGINFVADENTTKGKWEKLWQTFQEQIPDIPVWSNFTLFGEGVVEFPEMLKQIESHVNLFRREESCWDAAFQLYSGVIFLKNI